MVASTSETLDIREELEKLAAPNSYERDIFEQLEVLRKPLDEVADDNSLLQSEVLLIAAHVRQWLTEDESDLPPEMAYRLAARMVRMRLEGLLRTTRECFENSQGEVTITRKRRTGNLVISDEITRISQGDQRYLNCHQKVIMALARLDGVVAAPVWQRPERSPEEAYEAACATLMAQQQAEEELERQREETMLARRAAREAEEQASTQRSRQRAQEMLNQMNAARAARQEPLDSAEQAVEDHLYEGLQRMANPQSAPPDDSATNAEQDEACAASSEPKSASPAAKTDEKTTYNLAAALTDEQRQRRREFLSGAAVSDAA